MPRKAPNEVIEHRITFGDFERKEFKETLDQFDKFKRTQQIQQMITNGVYVAAAGGIEERRIIGEARLVKDSIKEFFDLDEGCELALPDAVLRIPRWVVGEAPVEALVDKAVPHVTREQRPEP